MKFYQCMIRLTEWKFMFEPTKKTFSSVIFQGILLMYGIYLAGLTDNLSCPPVNQSLTLISAVAIIFLFIGIMLVVNSFFYLWHNLVYGLTSGGIFVCMSSINCFIFIPQVRKQMSGIANYFFPESCI